MNKGTMTVGELQAFLCVGRKTAYELVNRKGFPAFRIGRKILVSREGLERWMKDQEGIKDAD